jgi:DUF1009 family protein
MAKLCVLAGSGALPYRVAEAAAQKREVFVIAYAGAAEKRMKEFAHAEFALLQINSIIKKIKEENCKQIVFIGKVERPTATGGNLIADIPAKLLELGQKEMVAQKQNSDEMMISLFTRYLEEVEGFTIVGAESILPDLTMKAGFLAGKTNDENKMDIALAIQVATAMGDLNVGQAAVVSQGQVLAVEAAEGTDKMLDRVMGLPQALRGDEKHRAGVLIKLPRRHQDLRIDMPTIGLETLAKVSKAGLAGIVCKENAILIDDRAALKEGAEKAGVFVQAVKVK